MPSTRQLNLWIIEEARLPQIILIPGIKSDDPLDASDTTVIRANCMSKDQHDVMLIGRLSIDANGRPPRRSWLRQPGFLVGVIVSFKTTSPAGGDNDSTTGGEWIEQRWR